MIARSIIPLVVVLLVAAAVPAQDTKQELQKLDGTWIPLKTDKELPGEEWYLTFDKNRAKPRLDAGYSAPFSRAGGGWGCFELKVDGKKARLIPVKTPGGKDSPFSEIICRVEGSSLIIESGVLDDQGLQKISLKGQWQRPKEKKE